MEGSETLKTLNRPDHVLCTSFSLHNFFEFLLLENQTDDEVVTACVQYTCANTQAHADTVNHASCAHAVYPVHIASAAIERVCTRDIPKMTGISHYLFEQRDEMKACVLVCDGPGTWTSHFSGPSRYVWVLLTQIGCLDVMLVFLCPGL